MCDERGACQGDMMGMKRGGGGQAAAQGQLQARAHPDP